MFHVSSTICRFTSCLEDSTADLILIEDTNELAS